MRKSKKNEKSVLAVGVPQTKRQVASPLLADSICFSGEKKLYGELRKNVPIIDGAIDKIVRLTGGFNVICNEKKNQKFLDSFLESVNVGGTSLGIESFIDIYLSQLLTFGTAIGEMVLNNENSFSLYNGELEDITLKRNSKNPMKTDIYPSGVAEKKICDDSKILLSVLSPEPGQIEGVSILRGLPFVSSVLMQILDATGSNWERVGNLRYAVTYRPTNDLSDKAFAADRAMQIAKGWQEAMKSGSEIKDFIAVGDVDIKVIGADSQILDSSTPVRQLLEQIVAKLGLPPFLLGLSWSTTERMAQQQCDILIGELYRYRRLLTPVIKKIAQTYLRMQGLTPDCHVEWSNISLLDTSQQAKTEYYLALAKKNTAQANAIGKGD